MIKIQPHVSPSEMPIPEEKKEATPHKDKPPIMTISSKIQILENAINSSILIFEKNQIASENLCSEYIKMLHSAQFFAFDLLLCEYLCGFVSQEEVENYIKNLGETYVDPNNFSQNDSLQLKQNFHNIFDEINSRIARLSVTNPNQINYDLVKLDVFDHFLTQVLKEQNAEKKQLDIKIQNKRKANDKAIKRLFDFELIPPFSHESISQMNDSLMKEFNYDDNDQSNLETRLLLSKACYRLLTIKQLQEQVTTMKSLVINHSTKIESSYCEPQSILKSPFFTSLATQSRFLRQSLKYQDKEVMLSNKFDECLSHINDSYQQYQQKCEKNLAEIDNRIAWLQNIYNQRSQAAEKQRNDLTPGIKEVVDEMNFLIDDKTSNRVDDLLHKVMNIKEPEKDYPNHKDWEQFMTTAKKEFNPRYTETESLYRSVASQIQTMAFYDSTIFNLSAEANDQPMKQKIIQSEYDTLINYEKCLHEINDSLSSIDYRPLMQNLERIKSNIKKAVDNHRKKLKAYEDNEMEDNDDEAETNDSLKEQISQLKAESEQLSQELGEQSAELDLLLEEKFAHQKCMIVPKQKAPPSDQTLNLALSGSIEKYLEWVMCPICRKNRRDSIIINCGHVFCRKCLERKRTCPICSQRFTDQDVKRLRFI